jgi:hypothetical protein
MLFPMDSSQKWVFPTDDFIGKPAAEDLNANALINERQCKSAAYENLRGTAKALSIYRRDEAGHGQIYLPSIL